MTWRRKNIPKDIQEALHKLNANENENEEDDDDDACQKSAHLEEESELTKKPPPPIPQRPSGRVDTIRNKNEPLQPTSPRQVASPPPLPNRQNNRSASFAGVINPIASLSSISPPPSEDDQQRMDVLTTDKCPNSNPEFVRTVWEYAADDSDELSFGRDELIFVLSFQPGGQWWTGVLRSGKKGTFPITFTTPTSPGPSTRLAFFVGAKIKDPASPHTPPDSPDRPHSSSALPARPARESVPISEGKLNHAAPFAIPSNPAFRNKMLRMSQGKGESRGIPRGAGRGRGGMVRLTPAAMLQQKPLPQPPVQSQQKVQKALCRARVISDFTAETMEEISLKEGTMVDVLVKDPDGWWTILEPTSHLRGIFPENYLEVL